MSDPASRPDTDTSVATLHMRFPPAAKDTKRLIGLRNRVDPRKVKMIINDPTIETEEQVLSITDRMYRWCAVKAVYSVSMKHLSEVPIVTTRP